MHVSINGGLATKDLAGPQSLVWGRWEVRVKRDSGPRHRGGDRALARALLRIATPPARRAFRRGRQPVAGSTYSCTGAPYTTSLSDTFGFIEHSINSSTTKVVPQILYVAGSAQVGTENY